ncbi:estradiol 17-beta-dehydrogenase 2-like [Saccostrea cucullata]|uniref:estradiol 17-beta-dehydrogenase 2-like n=1 Tax=Saccostrea cuccullata TaxID=36930 RepID=UPI002ED117AE
MWQVVLLVVLVIVWYLWYNARASGIQRITVRGQGVLITGCDTGIGHDLARRLDDMGFHVFAGCLVGDGPEASELTKSCSNRLHVIQLDVTKEKQIRAAKSYVETLHKQTGSLGCC